MSFKKILVPLDGTELAERALVPTLALAEAMLAKVFFVRVAIPLSLNLDPELYQGIIEMRQYQAKRYFRSIQPRFSSSQADIESQVLVGRAARSILNFAQEKEIELKASLILPMTKRWI